MDIGEYMFHMVMIWTLHKNILQLQTSAYNIFCMHLLHAFVAS